MAYIVVEQDTSHGTAKMLPSLKPSKILWDADPLAAAMLIGWLTSPPRYAGFDLGTFWAWLRYVPALDHRVTELRLRRLWSSMNPHHKTILSDDFGVGFPCLYLMQNHGFTYFADTEHVLRRVLPKGTAWLKKTPSKKGPAKSPDYVAMDGLGRFHILECKGSQDSHKKLDAALARVTCRVIFGPTET